MEYDNIPTTVFSPTEYSYVGLSEEQALETYPEDKVEVYHRETTPL
jgi:pyruvate/2-oxoglutarate dehydrogenase complex dihydrolipoamide dehydrogenase (E3) component